MRAAVAVLALIATAAHADPVQLPEYCDGTGTLAVEFVDVATLIPTGGGLAIKCNPQGDNFIVRLRDKSGRLGTALSVSPARTEVATYGAPAILQTVRMDPALGPQGRFQAQGTASGVPAGVTPYYNALEIITTVTDNRYGHETARVDLYLVVNGYQVKVATFDGSGK